MPAPRRAAVGKHCEKIDQNDDLGLARSDVPVYDQLMRSSESI